MAYQVPPENASGSSLDKLRTGFSALSARVRSSSVAASKTLTEQVTHVSGRMKELFAAPTAADRSVEEATAEGLVAADWAKNIEICDGINNGNLNSVDAVRAIKRRLALRNAHVQLLALTLLETATKNCDRVFADIAAEKVLDDMVRAAEEAGGAPEVREKCLKLLEAWGEATDELRYLPVFEETYKSLKSRGVRFPGRDNESLAPIFTPPQSVPIVRTPPPLPVDVVVGDVADPKEALDVARNSVELLSTVLTSAPQQEALQDELTGTLVAQCRQSQRAVQRIIERAGEDETLLFEALSVHDELEKVLKKYDSMRTNGVSDFGETREGPAALVAVSANEEEEEGGVGEGVGLVRKKGVSRGGEGSADETEAMAHLDEVIFGTKEEGKKEKKKEDDDMIVF